MLSSAPMLDMFGARNMVCEVTENQDVKAGAQLIPVQSPCLEVQLLERERPEAEEQLHSEVQEPSWLPPAWRSPVCPAISSISCSNWLRLWAFMFRKRMPTTERSWIA
jgi:hypothetical protein